MIERLNFKKEDKNLIITEVNHNYSYYEYTEEKIRTIVLKNVNDVTNDDWRLLVQMLYPDSLIASGLFQPLVLFKIENQRRVDPPFIAFDDVTSKNKETNESIIEMVWVLLNSYQIPFDKSWKEALEKLNELD